MAIILNLVVYLFLMKSSYKMEPGRNIADYALEFAAGHLHLEAKREKNRDKEECEELGEDQTDDATEAEFKVQYSPFAAFFLPVFSNIYVTM